MTHRGIVSLTEEGCTRQIGLSKGEGAWGGVEEETGALRTRLRISSKDVF